MFIMIRYHNWNRLAIFPTFANYSKLCKMTSFCPLVIVCFLLALSPIFITAADPDPLQDFCVADTSAAIFMNGLPCINPTKVTAKNFMTSDLGILTNTSASRLGFNFVITVPENLPGANTQGLTMIRLDTAVGGLVPPHVHPRASEMVYILQGKFNVGFVDTSNKLFSVNVEPGDVFMIPRGLVHYQLNIGGTPGLFLAVLNSQNPGFAIVHQNIFGSNPTIPTEVLSKAFNISPQEVEKIEKGLGGN